MELNNYSIFYFLFCENFLSRNGKSNDYLNLNSVGMVSGGSGLATNSIANDSDMLGIHDMNSMAAGMGNTSLHDDADAYYTGQPNATNTNGGCST